MKVLEKYIITYLKRFLFYFCVGINHNEMRKWFVIFFLCNVWAILAQENFMYWIQFKHKNQNRFSIDRPEEFLSQQSILRRNKHNIPIDSTDLPVNNLYVDSIVRLTDGVIKCSSKWLNGITLVINDTSSFYKVRNLSFVKNIELTKTISSQQKIASMPDKLQTETSPDEQMAIDQKAVHNLPFLHNLGFDGEGMKIAVIDGGFYHVNTLSAFDDLQLIGTRDFVSPSADIFEQHSHGMHVLSIMAANLPGKMVGTAPRASYLLLRSEDTSQEYKAETDFWVSAIEYADSIGVDLVNSSLGYSNFDHDFMNFSYSDLNGKNARISIAATIAAHKGILVINSAGNEGGNPWHYICAPADADSIITVGGIDSNLNHVEYSSYGPTYDGRIKPTLSAIGKATAYIDTEGNVSGGNGTSFSAPILCGLAACLWQAFPELSNMEIIDLLINNSSQSNSPDNMLGYGIPDVQRAFYSQTAIEKVKTNNSVQIFPTPFNDELNIIIPSNDAYELEIINPQGVTIYKKHITSSEILRTSQLKQGFYLIRLKGKTNSYFFKTIKN